VNKQVPIKDAAELLGVSEITVRRRIKANELLAIKSETPQGYRWLVVLEDEEPDQIALSPADQSPGLVPESGDQPLTHPDTERLIRSLEERLTFAEDQIRFLQTQIIDRTRETEQLHILLSQAMRALPAEISPAPGQVPTHPADQ
jgi:hypothetical protein